MSSSSKKTSSKSEAESALPAKADPDSRTVGKPEPPPLPPGQNINLALGMNLQRASFDSMDPDVQSKMIQLSDAMDQRQYDYYSQSLKYQADYSRLELDDKGVGRKQALLAFTLLGGCCLLLGGGIIAVLLYKDQFQIAQTVAISGITFAAGLLGGAGIPSILKYLSSTQ